MKGHGIPEAELRRALALIITHFDAGRPLTGPSLGEALGMSAEGGRIRRDRLIDRGLVEVVPERNSAARLHPTPAARILDLPKVLPPQTATSPRKSRPCMRCRESFMSHGPHHRHCDRCRRSLTDMADARGFAY